MATSEITACQAFASPYGLMDQRFLETIAVEYAREFALRFVEGCHRSIRGRSLSLLQFLGEKLEGRLAFNTVWDECFGQARYAVLQKSMSGFARRAAGLGLRLIDCGCLGEWEIELETPARLRLANYLLPSATWVRVNGASGEITVRLTRNGKTRVVRFWRSSSGWETQGAIALPIAERRPLRCAVAPRAAVNTFPLDDVCELSSTVFRTAQRDLCLAADLVAQCAPIYLPWIGQVLRQIIPVRSRRKTIFSGSDQDHPGTIYLSFSCPAVAIAEMLIHEASHQYFYLLARFGALHDASGRSFFSPIKRAQRPISMILLAYHAFGNVALFYRMRCQRGLDHDGYCQMNGARLLPQLHEMQDTLMGARALTPFGDALWRPLAERLW